MGLVKIVEVIDRDAGKVKIMLGSSSINTTLPQSIQDELERRRQRVERGMVVDWPGMGSKHQTHRRKRRNTHQRIVPTKIERDIRKWRRRRVKITIELIWKGRIYGQTEIKEEEESEVDLAALESDIAVWASIRGMEDTAKAAIDALKKAREPPKESGTKPSKDNFVPSRPYYEVMKDIRKVGEEWDSKIRLERIEEVGFEKIVFHIFGGNVAKGESEQKKKTITGEEWSQIDELVEKICNIPGISRIKSVKVEEK